MSEAVTAEEQLRRNVLELMKAWRWNQATLAERLGRSQPWISRRLTENEETGTRFQFSDLDALAAVFGLSPAELLQPKYGKWDRRAGQERRSGIDRRGYGAPRRTPDNGSVEEHRSGDRTLTFLPADGANHRR